MTGYQINSFYDLEGMSEESMIALGIDKLKELLNEAKEEQRDLNRQYMEGDRNSYPPDWYDQYVFPIDCIIRDIGYAIDEIKNDEEESEEDSWEY